ncbi:M3 family metallopeptidase [Blochmannia endosymbiont of Camponotus sp.]|uniref:M3 family metallopeptidase n=1 Tax=Blochmannia endosymbiont of Camponotus sp. TaxID=700220 RepID=UPI0020257E31|nr:M3 family metallopeptidase [Blochmannia endosymbiont of Camponotus sp.]URJ29766.1 M3 family metallopeptidase [Blochmannia endosymbiont of Camponotus sp.]
MHNDSLFHSFVFPLFSSIDPKYIKESIQQVLTNCYNTVDQVVSKENITWDTLYYPLMIAENELQRTWSPIAHLNSVKHNLELRKVYEESLLLISEYKNWVDQHYGLYKSYQLLQNGDSYQQLSIIQKKVINNILCNFRLSGVDLSLNQKKKCIRITSRLSRLSLSYANNVFDATLGWSKLITEKKVLSGIPEGRLENARLEAQAHGEKGWLFTLQYPSYSSVLLYCDTQVLREELYWAFNTRASDQGPNSGRWDNTIIMDEILALRHELAQILGFNNYLEKSLMKRMIQNPEQAFNFLTSLSTQICHNEYKEFLEIKNFAKTQYSCVSLNPWDLAYYREKRKQYLFSIIPEELRYYFPEKKVLHGMFLVVNRIYGIFIKERCNVETWHPDVRFFDIFDDENKWMGGFYLDLYLRKDKREGAWMDELVGMMYRKDAISQKPIAYLTCNFSRLDDKKSSCLLTHNDVITLFHEFGHVLHHVMTRIDVPEISGINGVPWDAVELPSQFMEKFCWEPDVLRLISSHYKTKEPLPDCVINNLLKIKTYQSSSYLLRQVIYGLFDLRVHYEYVPGERGNALKVFNEVVKKISTHNFPKNWERFPHSFIHIFSDDYGAGYYSYLWADMLASNIWYRFKKSGILSPEIGKIFLNNIIALGGVIDLKQCLIEFCERAVTIESMLRYYKVPISADNNNLLMQL